MLATQGREVCSGLLVTEGDSQKGGPLCLLDVVTCGVLSGMSRFHGQSGVGKGPGEAGE